MPLSQVMRADADAATRELINGRYVRMYPFPANMDITLTDGPKSWEGPTHWWSQGLKSWGDRSPLVPMVVAPMVELCPVGRCELAI